MPDCRKPRLVVATVPSEPAEAENPSMEVPPEPSSPATEPVVLRRAAAPRGGEYQATPDGLRLVREGDELPLTNFDVVVTRRVRVGDRTTLQLRVTLDGRKHEIDVSTRVLETLRWVAEVPGAVIWPGPGTRHHLLTAIALLSRDEQIECAAYDRLGWTQMTDGTWAFVHGGGMLGDRAQRDVLVQVSAPLDRLRLPDPPRGDAARDALRSLLSLLDVAPDRVTVPLLASTIRATLGSSTMGKATMGVMLVGETGAGKSALAAVYQSTMGATMAYGSGLPTSWSSTRNAVEETGHLWGEAVMIVDDLVIGVQGSEVDLDFIVRNMSQGQGRARMGRPARPMRCLPIVTAERMPTLPSLVARLVVLPLARGDLDWGRVSEGQRLGSSGVLASAMSAWICWLAPQLDEILGRHASLVEQLRPTFTSAGTHARVPEALAQLGSALLLLADFARDLGVLDEVTVRRFVARCRRALTDVRDGQLAIQRGIDPARLFAHVLRRLIESGSVRVTADLRDDGNVGGPPLVGWIRGDDLLIVPELAVEAVQAAIGGTGQRLDLPETVLARGLREAAPAIITAVDVRGGKVRYTRRVTAGGVRRAVWVTRAAAFGIGGDRGSP